MALTVPIRTSSVASIQRTTISRLTHLEPKEHDASEDNILATETDIYDEPGYVEEKNLLDDTDPGSIDMQKSVMEGVNYDPSRFYNRASPIGDDDGDITEPVGELEDDSNEDPIISDLPERPNLILRPDPNAIPDAVVNYRNENAADPIKTQVKLAIGLTPARTLDEKRQSRVHYNAQYLNNVFYNKDYVKAILNMREFDFLEYFHPNMITHSFPVRLKTANGSLGDNPEMFRMIQLRPPLPAEPTELKTPHLNDPEDDPTIYLTEYLPTENWFGVDLSSDMDHVIYCMNLYSITGFILYSNDLGKSLPADWTSIMGDWKNRVIDHYEKMKAEAPYSNAWYREIQYLHDLMWNFLDNPLSVDTCSMVMCGFASAMSISGRDQVTVLDHDLFTKADFEQYLCKELNLPDDCFLLPEFMEYPIFNRASVRLAMDSIRRVEMEYPMLVQEFTKNLNRMYRVMGCSFAITPDHPYAKYADPYIRKNMVNILIEGDSVVNDNDGASDIGGPGNKVEQPWYKRLDYTGALYRDGSENKELGPNTKPMQKPDYTQYDSFL